MLNEELLLENAIAQKLDPEIVRYVETKVIPRYRKFDRGHNEDHVRKVINSAMDISSNLIVNKNIVYVAAAFHDVGLEVDREYHEEAAYDIVKNDKFLQSKFNESELELIGLACKEHRSSSKNVPKSIYSRIICDADNYHAYDIASCIERAIYYRLDRNQYDKEEIRKGVYNHLKEKFGRNGYVNFHLDVTKRNIKGQRDKFYKIMDSEEEFKRIYDSVYDSIDH